ncbi:MAG: CoA transferase [Gammaproteobacteria bacterium]|nr:CoA transferase [Gammaproteobacteria bacterium]MYJ51678.1 CoA transferase [Gammaproteobacteria bacterium]
MTGPLEGIRVLDLTRILAGPWCTQLLGDLGAEIIKIEHPRGGDDTRHWGPPWLRDSEGRQTDQAAYFFCANRNKYSVTLNLKTEQGVDILRQLVAKSDVFVENFKTGGLRKMGLDYPSLSSINPDLIYLSITGFGQTGPMSDQPGYDYMIQGLGGLMSITGESDDRPGGGPQRVGVPISDVNTGFYGAAAILSALYHRAMGGGGQHIDLALLDCQVGWLVNQAMNYLIGEEVPARTGNAHPNLVPYQPFQASDGMVIIAVGNDSQFRSLCRLLEAPELGSDPRYSTNAARVEHREELARILAGRILLQPVGHWIRVLPESGVPCSRINNIKEVFEHPQVQARNMRIDLPHPLSGTVPSVANPIRFSQTGVTYRNAPPMLGQHSAQILQDILGYEAATISELSRNGVV